MTTYTIQQKYEAMAWYRGLSREDKKGVLAKIGPLLSDICKHYFTKVSVNVG